MNTKIRKFRKEEAIKVFNIIKKGWSSLISKKYPEKAVENQIKENSPKKIIEKAKKVHYYVALYKNIILGVGGYNEKKVQTFFVKSEIHRMGIGSKIMKRVLTDAKKEGLKSLDCWSTFCAEKFYSSFDFRRKQVIKVQNKNNPISFVLMTKKLK